MGNRKLLAVIDYQNDFVDGALGFPAAAEIDGGIANLVHGAFAEGTTVLLTYDTHGADYLNTREGRALPIPHCDPTQPGWRLYGKTQELISCTCCTHQLFEVHKNSFGMKPEDVTALAAQLGDIDEILVVGIVTNLCVISNAILLQAQWPNAKIIVDAALCRSPDYELEKKAFDIMEGLQFCVINR